MQKIPLGAALVVIGVLVLWITVTGRLDRVPEAWRVLKGESQASGSFSGLSQSAARGGQTLARARAQLATVLHG